MKIDSDHKNELIKPNDSVFPIMVFEDEINLTRKSEINWGKFLQVVHITSGVGIITINGQPYEIKKGDIIIINPHELFQFEKEPDVLIQIEAIHIDYNLFLSQENNSITNTHIIPLIKQKIVFKNIISNRYIKMLTLNLFKLMQTKPDYYQIDSKIKVLEIISNLYKNDFAITNKSSKSRTIKSQNDIKTIISYIKDHYNSKISLDQLASISSMSKYHLCHVFKEKTGSSISNYHQNYRLKVATDLLTNTTMNINQISRKIGYNSPSYFVKKFKETYNLSPNRYRKKHI